MVKRVSSLSKKDLVVKVSDKVKKTINEKITNDQLTKIFDYFLEAIRTGLKEGKSVNLKSNFNLNVKKTKRTIKVNPRNRKEKLIIPAQNRIKISVSDSWKGELNPLIKTTNLLKRAKSRVELDKIYKEAKISSVYRDKDNAQRIDKTYSDLLSKKKK